MAEKAKVGRGSGWCRLFLLLLALTLCFLCGTAAARDKENETSWGKIVLASDGDETDALRSLPTESREHAGDGTDSDSDVIVDEDVEGAFSSLDGMLQWAIGKSDPAKLKEKANDVQRMSADELSARRLEIKELMEKLKMPSDTDLMKIAIDDLHNSSTSLEDRQRALNELLTLVEPIDNANDLDKLGGLDAIILELNHSSTQIRMTSAWILGKASQNNPVVQRQVLSRGALTMLMKLVKSSSVEESLKAFYAISALIRNNVDGQALFFAESGSVMLQDIMRNSSADLRLRKKAVQMVADLADSQREENAAPLDLSLFRSPALFQSVVDLLSSPDVDLLDKALMAVGSLLRLPHAEALIVDDPCGLSRVLEALRERIAGMSEEFAVELEAQRGEVDAIFRQIERENR